MFTANQVWACAVAADRINNGYIKEPMFAATATHGIDYNNKIKEANKILVKNWLRLNDFSMITEDDYINADSVREHFNSYTLLALRGGINDFQQTALKLAQKDEFTGRDIYEFAVISCLPEVVRRDRERSDYKRDLFASEQLQGTEGDEILGDIVVTSARFNNEYNKFKITARMNEAFVDFWHTKNPAVGATVRIKGKIKRCRPDKTTQLNYVKFVG